MTLIFEMPTSSANERRLLDEFLVDNQELEALDARLRTFNILEVLGVSRAELRHSNLLAWFLNPAGSHGLGDAFLRRFLSRLVRDKQDLNVQFRPAQIELMPLGDAEVFREWRHIDILVRSRSGRWALLIENKIGASESTGQLARYMDEAQSALDAKEFIPILLTLDGEDPSEAGREAGFVSLSWGEVLELLDRLVLQHATKIPPEAKVLIDHYLV